MSTGELQIVARAPTASGRGMRSTASRIPAGGWGCRSTQCDEIPVRGKVVFIPAPGLYRTCCSWQLSTIFPQVFAFRRFAPSARPLMRPRQPNGRENGNISDAWTISAEKKPFFRPNHEKSALWPKNRRYFGHLTETVRKSAVFSAASSKTPVIPYSHPLKFPSISLLLSGNDEACEKIETTVPVNQSTVLGILNNEPYICKKCRYLISSIASRPSEPGI